MPTNHVSAEVMDVGSRGGGKHWTAAEVEARQAAAEGVKRKSAVVLRVPSWLDDDARKIWYKVKKDAAELELLDNLDSEMLAIYCDAVVRYREASRQQGQSVTVLNTETMQAETMTVDNGKALQAWARLIASYADKLGFTPAARARLVKKKAAEMIDEFGDEFD